MLGLAIIEAARYLTTIILRNRNGGVDASSCMSNQEVAIIIDFIQLDVRIVVAHIEHALPIYYLMLAMIDAHC